MERQAVTEVRGVWKRYSRADDWVLSDVDLAVEAGTMHVVLGGNGQGKSTLLRILAGVSSPSRGEVHRPQHSISYLPERPPAVVHLSAGRYLAHMARLRGPGHEEVLARSLAILERLQLSITPDVPVALLSKGNRQKLSLAQAFGFPAEVTILDEPFSGLDPDGSREVQALLAETRADGRSLLISAHHPAMVEDADALHLMTGGRLRALDGQVPAPRPAAAPAAAAVPDEVEVPPSRLVLRAVQAAASPSRLVLRAVQAAASPSRLTALPEVRSLDHDPASGQVTLLTSDPDLVLRTALGHGWSFIQGSRIEIGDRA